MNKDKIRYQPILRDIARSMVSLNRPRRLLKMITRLIDRKFFLTHTSFLALDESCGRFVFVDSKGSSRLPLKLIRIDLDHPIVMYFQRGRKGVSKKGDYLEYSRLKKKLEKSSGKRGRLPEICRTMESLKAGLVVPGFYKGKLLGMLLMGSKRDGRPFSSSEISFFQILAQDCSMALKTAEYHESLVKQNEELARRLHEIQGLRKKEQETYTQIMRSLAQEVYAKDTYTYGHVSQVERLGMMTAREMGLDVEGPRGQILRAGLILHDVGKIGIPDHILKKKSSLTGDEWQVMRTHPERGARILQPLSDFKEVAEIVLSHHECWNGSGYPRGLKGEEIPLEARIVAVVDTFHAIVSTRCYSKGRTVNTALEELERCAGRQFDPQVVTAFISALKREMKKRGVGFLKDDPEDSPRAA